ncbi:MAG: PDZ domain-containing protein, partial [Gammaproteobacteria bacterium]|nr:PDZ domain-containing protein [Gammaproteobacteria bacterium]
SGGALINLRGELIGINSAIFSQTGGNIGIGFAIPVNIAKSIMTQLIEYGEVQRGLLGVSISNFNADVAAALGIDDDVEGALVQEIVPESAAETAGIQVSDIIIEIDGQQITGASDLRTTIGLRRSGDTLSITLIRNGKRKKLKATLTKAEDMQALAADDIHPNLAGAEFENFSGEEGSGVLVSAVAPGSPAAMSGLRTNDLIVAVNRQAVSSVRELSDLAAGQNLLILSLRRDQRNLLLQIR